MNLDNFPSQKSSWTIEQKVLIIIISVGLVVLIWYLFWRATQKKNTIIAEQNKTITQKEQEQKAFEENVKKVNGESLLAYLRNKPNGDDDDSQVNI